MRLSEKETWPNAYSFHIYGKHLLSIRLSQGSRYHLKKTLHFCSSPCLTMTLHHRTHHVTPHHKMWHFCNNEKKLISLFDRVGFVQVFFFSFFSSPNIELLGELFPAVDNAFLLLAKRDNLFIYCLIYTTSVYIIEFVTQSVPCICVLRFGEQWNKVNKTAGKSKGRKLKWQYKM